MPVFGFFGKSLLRLAKRLAARCSRLGLAGLQSVLPKIKPENSN